MNGTSLLRHKSLCEYICKQHQQKYNEGHRHGIGFATLFLALCVTFRIVPSTCAAPIDGQKNHALYSKKTTMEGTQDSTSLRFKNCAELYKSGQKISGVYTIDPDGSDAFDVYCDQTTAGGGWEVFQKRFNGFVDFNRTWDDYKHGFGNFTGEFWLGLDKIYRLTRNETKNMLRVDLGKATGETVHVEYSWFGIGSETAMYRLYIGNVTNDRKDAIKELKEGGKI
ncbi:angiopoietin-related protein 7-like isoform X2 [Stylophora pistillata]|uniref:angiopoietin-related protein 7-like isoform X2 n=1 Tax=Stylophora pistillata TaxID=50429 RepID=UPI000C047F4F|nr:angiopoietin-related protein 7-like isoform X2 [Stylophora pistillata]